MKLLVVITAYRARDLTFDCLKSLESEVAENPGIKVGICDNGNEDDTAEFLNQAIKENNWQDWAYVKTVMPNRGFSGGNNVILNDALNSDAEYDFFLLLNADTIVRPGAIGILLNVLQKNPDVGIVGPRIEGIEGDPQVSCFNYISPISEIIKAAQSGPITRLFDKWNVPIQPEKVTETPDWISFCCVLIRKQVIDQVGVLDEGYFLYFDDVDYCRSTRNSGWQVIYEPGAVVVHYEGQSNPVVENTRKMQRRPDYWYHSRSWYFAKFYGKTGLLTANLLWYLGRSISFARELVGNKKPHVCKAEWRDIWKGFLRSK
jgi:N-acetylglucosaminyl-diphospho-decaprenol L-rhamnosyltransferase